MFIKTFHGGVSVPERKELTVEKKIKAIPAPQEIVLPLSQHIGASNEPLVKAGGEVRIGQRIAEAKAFVSAPVHSPVSGKVKTIQDIFNPVYGKRPAAIIENDGNEDSLPFVRISSPETLSRVDLIQIVKDAGIVGLGGAAFPTHVKLNVPKEKHLDSLIINGAECEPYLTCDHRLMAEKTDEILKGVCLAAKMLSVKNVFLAIEENKLSAIFAMEKGIRQLSQKIQNLSIQTVVLKTKYPQGGEKQLLKAILKREVSPGKLPMDAGAMVQNVGTCFAIYEAVYHGKPLIERCITVTGSILKSPGNFLVRLGTPLKYIIDYCGGLTELPAKIIIGGPMMGITQYNLDIPVIKGVTGVVFLSKKEATLFEETPCIRCAKCVDVCPVNLVPTEIMRMVKHSRWHYLEELHASDCMECGACSFDCPSKIPLVQYVKLAKRKETEKR